MKHINTKISTALLLLTLLIVAFGCGGGGSDTPYSPIVTGTTSGATGGTTGTPTADFTVGVSPAQQTMQNGSSPTNKTPGIIPTNQVNFTITVSATNGFSGNVNLSASSHTGFSTAFSKNPITVDAAHASATSVLTITRNQVLSQTGNVPFTVTATGGGITHTSTATVVLVNGAPASFTVTVTPKSEIVNNGDFPPPGVLTVTRENDFDVRVSAVGGFTGTVKLAVNGLLPNFGGGLSNDTVSLTSQFQVVDVSLRTSAIHSGSTTFTVVGTSGSLTSSDTASLVGSGAPTYTVTVNPSSLSMRDLFGEVTSTNVSMTSVNGFSGTVKLSLVSQTYGFFDATFTTTTLNVPANGTASTTLTLATTDNTIVDGTYTLLVAATNGTQTQLGAGNLVLFSSAEKRR